MVIEIPITGSLVAWVSGMVKYPSTRSILSGFGFGCEMCTKPRIVPRLDFLPMAGKAERETLTYKRLSLIVVIVRGPQIVERHRTYHFVRTGEDEIATFTSEQLG